MKNNLFLVILLLSAFQFASANTPDSCKIDKQYHIYRGVTLNADESASSVEVAYSSDRDSHVYLSAADFINARLRSYNGTVRGRRSNDGGPIVLVDGLERDFNTLTFNQIESVVVLKENIATTLYGQKGANGVILVITKEGVAGEFNVRVNYQEKLTVASNPLRKADAANHARAYNEARVLNGDSPHYTAAEIEAYENGTYPYRLPNVDWYDELLKNTKSARDLFVEFSGGNDKIQYFSSLNYSENGSFKKQLGGAHYDYSNRDLQRSFNFTNNLNLKLSETTQAKIRFSGLYRNNYSAGLNDWGLHDIVYTTPANAMPVRTKNNIWGTSYSNRKNPVAAVVDIGYQEDFTKSYNVGIELNQDLKAITPGLSASLAVQYGVFVMGFDFSNRGHEVEYVFGDLDDINNKFSNEGQTIFGTNTVMGFGAGDASLQKRNNYDGVLKYQRQFGKHKILSFINAFAEDKVFRSYGQTWFNINFGGYLQYMYDNKYIFNVSSSMSGYSSYRPEHRWQNVKPSFALGYIISNENFMKQIKPINFMKLRANYGYTFSENDKSGNPYVQYGYGGQYFYGAQNGHVNGIAENFLPYSDIVPELSHIKGVGVDLRVFNDFDFTFDYWKEERTRMVINAKELTPSTYGHPGALQCLGQLDSWGYEFSVGYQKQIKDFKVGARFNYSFWDNKLIESGEAEKLYAWQEDEGHPTDRNKGLIFEGFWNTQEEIDANKISYELGSTLRPGDVKYKDVNEDGVINSNDIVPMGGTGRANINYSGLVELQYKKIGLNMYFHGVAKISGFDMTNGLHLPFVNNTSVTTLTDDRWTPDNMENAKYPRYTVNRNPNNHQNSAIYLKNKARFVLNKLDLYYNFNNIKFKGKKICDAKLSLTGNNLFTIDHYKNRSINGAGFVPQQRVFTLGCDIKF